MSAAFDISGLEPPPFRFALGEYELLVDGDPDVGDVVAAVALVEAFDRGEPVDEQVRELAVRLLCELSSPAAIGFIVTAPPAFQRPFFADVLAQVAGGALARARKAARAAHEVTRHLPPPRPGRACDAASAACEHAARSRESKPSRHLAAVRDGPDGDDPPLLLDPALVEQARQQMRGVPSLVFSVDYEGYARLVPNCLNEDEELRLREQVRREATWIEAAFADLLETWCAR